MTACCSCLSTHLYLAVDRHTFVILARLVLLVKGLLLCLPELISGLANAVCDPACVSRSQGRAHQPVHGAGPAPIQTATCPAPVLLQCYLSIVSSLSFSYHVYLQWRQLNCHLPSQSACGNVSSLLHCDQSGQQVTKKTVAGSASTQTSYVVQPACEHWHQNCYVRLPVAFPSWFYRIEGLSSIKFML